MNKFHLACLAVLLPSSAHAEKVLIDRDNSASSGVEIVAGGWNRKAHTDNTYKAFDDFKKGGLGKYDFYYSLEIVPQFSPDYKDCKSNPNFLSYVKSFFGIARGSIMVIRTSIDYRWATGSSISLLPDKSALILSATGADSTKAAIGSGCYFDHTKRPTFPLVQYRGGDANSSFDDFQLKLSVEAAAVQDYKIVSNVTSIFSDVSAASAYNVGLAGLASPAFKAFQNIAENFQKNLNAAGTYADQVSVIHTMRARGNPDDNRVVITIPAMFGGNPQNGSLAIYIKRMASIGLAGDPTPIKPDDVLTSIELASRQCPPQKIASSGCDATNSSVREAVATALKAVDDAIVATSPVAQVFDLTTDGRKSKVYDLCQSIRTVARTKLQLSTLDEMLVRWAITKDSGLQAELSDPSKAATLAAAQKPKAVTVADLKNMCWNTGDDETLRAVAKSLKRSLS
ncbi:hypothetical protein [Tardiphaga sp. P9-11]|uniref:hypothetical protein n=1 Tax=Tardiphaga sp. P9-11 TaxID=2024614 RepID=UPI0011F38800|nr:hypothetical protein [Tardiphaga sp. P9-11]KAA0078248.1 hypothetical protein CIW50_04370 [Tardiphaga sp. P9-11]